MNKSTIYLLAKSLFLVLAIPLASYWVASSVLSNYDSMFVENIRKEIAEFPKNFSISEVCVDPSFSTDSATVVATCSNLANIKMLEYGSIVFGIFGLVVLFAIWLAGFVARGSRDLLVALFKPGLKLTQFSIAILVLGHGILLVAAIFFAESFWFSRVHFALIGGVMIITLIGAFNIVKSLFSNFKNIETSVFGVSLNRSNAPKLWSLIDDISKEAQTEPPDHLIVGLSPSFFVTEALVRASDGDYNGRTLYISVPFCRLLSVQELKSIISHELGHFVGLDTKFSRHFYPIYRGAQESISILHNQRQSQGLLRSVALLPSTYLMAFFMETFGTLQTKISRDRELEADALAGRISGNDHMASALVKVHVFSSLWHHVEQSMAEYSTAGQPIENAAQFFENLALNLPLSSAILELGESHTEHPTDSHPSLNSRLKALGFEFNEQMLVQMASKVEVSASSSIDSHEEIEVSLTEAENSKISERPGFHSRRERRVAFNLLLLRSMISLALSDGILSEKEVSAIRKIYSVGTHADLTEENFEKEIEAVRLWNEQLPEYLVRSNLRMSGEDKALMLRALLLTAVADGEIHPHSKELVDRVVEVLKVDQETFITLVNDVFNLG